MSVSNSTPKNPRKSAAVTRPVLDLDERILKAQQAIPLPPHPFIEQGLAAATLDNVHRLLDVLNVLEVRKDYEMPDGGENDLLGLRASLIAATKYAAELVEIEDEMRGAARRLELEVAHV
jgi:hypothetical protein